MHGGSLVNYACGVVLLSSNLPPYSNLLCGGGVGGKVHIVQALVLTTQGHTASIYTPVQQAWTVKHTQ